MTHAKLPTEDAVEVKVDQDSQLADRWIAGGHIPQLDGVRGIAILAVTLYRFLKEIEPDGSFLLTQVRRFAPVGERGVDLFFVLSGVLITGILLRSRGKAGYFRNFLTRRALRIFPLYFIALAICLYAVPKLLNAPSFNIPPSEQLYLWTYTSNLRMSWLNEWSFGPLDHFWSLAVEEHFYLLWPAIVWLVAPKLLLRLSIVWVLIVFLWRTYLATMPAYDIAVDVHSVLRSDALCLGGIVAIVLQTCKNPSRFQNWAWAIALVTFAGAAITGATGMRFLTVPNTIIPLLCASVIFLLLYSTPRSAPNRIAASSPLRWLGKYSYGMYVVQLPLVTLLPASRWASTFSGNETQLVLFYSAYVAGMFALTATIAWCSYHLIEQHFLKLKDRFSN